MHHTATHRPTSGQGSRRLPAVAAIATAAGIALAGCTGGGGTEQQASPAPQTAASSSSPSVTPTPDPAEDTAPAAPAAHLESSPVSTAPAAATSTRLPALVVDGGGPCHRIGEVAQAMDGSPLFCLDDPGGAGPLWLPQPESAPDATGPALLDRPCMQEGLVVTAPDGRPLTCDLTGDGTTPGGLFWTR